MYKQLQALRREYNMVNVELMDCRRAFAVGYPDEDALTKRIERLESKRSALASEIRSIEYIIEMKMADV